ncbi:hypothetical protein B5C34_08305 [Pacificimonas flava]|uniref:Ancillary SecYEG translocon subunit/Cell division coordinator CpoB TPR domain-containing protein n=2 Tax=Pacificimonas TaxID=1960290 RepID=A0A219B500_9SPHN|nr:hypothetical protein B5C34_08305 [Pacificimonas flava]
MREVDDAYRQDQLTGFWSRFGRPLLIILGIALIAFAGYLWWQEQKAADAAVQAEEFDQALKGLDLGNPQSIETIERLAGSDVRGYSDLSKLLAAGFLVEDGDIDGAIAAYSQIENNPSIAQPLRDLAAIRAAQLGFDDAEPAELTSRLAPLAQPGTPWFGVAGELLAAAYLKEGETDRAAELYVAMAGDEDLPPTLRDRASQMAAAYGGAVDDELALDEPTAPEAANLTETSADETAE